MSIDYNLDRREAILERIYVVLQALPGLASAWRNRRGLKDAELPAAVVLDADEVVTTPILPNKSVRVPPVMVRMSPQIFVGVRFRDDVTNMRLETVLNPVGTELNRWRFAIYAALTNDPTLLDLVTTNGQIAYRDSETDLKSGSTIGALGAQLKLSYDFHYPLFPPR